MAKSRSTGARRSQRTRPSSHVAGRSVRIPQGNPQLPQQTTSVLRDSADGRIIATAADERLKNAQASQLEAEAEATRLRTDRIKRELEANDRRAASAPSGAGGAGAMLARNADEYEARSVTGSRAEPANSSGGVLGVAIERVGHCIGQVKAAGNRVASRADYLTGIVPESAGKDATGPGMPSGSVHELHFLLTRLEAEITALHKQIDRIDGL